jgi:hypothetical protein
MINRLRAGLGFGAICRHLGSEAEGRSSRREASRRASSLGSLKRHRTLNALADRNRLRRFAFVGGTGVPVPST